MTLPGWPASTRRRATRCVHSSTWRRLLLYSASQPFSVVSSSGESNTPPALLTRIDTVPSSLVVRCSAASTCSLSRTSVTMPSGADGFRGRRAGLGVALPDRDRGAERGQPRGDAAADARSPAGHDRDAAGEQDVGRIDGHSGRGYPDFPCRAWPVRCRSRPRPPVRRSPRRSVRVRTAARGCARRAAARAAHGLARARART